MRAVFVIAAKDLGQRLRDRSALVMGFVAPLIIATLMSLAFGSTQHFHTDVAVVDHDRGTLATAFADLLGSDQLRDVVTVKSVPDEATARRRVDDGKLGAAFVIPAGFTADATAGRPTAISVISSVDTAIAGQVCASLADSFVAQVNADRLSVHTALAAGADPSRISVLAEAAGRRELPERAVAATTGTRAIDAISYFGPAMGIFFMLFGISFTARSFFIEQRDGTLDRMAAAPVSMWQIVAGKSLSLFGYGVASLTTMAVITSAVFGAYWGPPAAVAALIAAVVLAAVALTGLVIVLARTEQQAEGFSSIVVFGLVLLGGNFVFVSAAPSLLRKLSLLTPNGWALRGFVDLNSGAGAGSVLVPVLAILGFTAVIAAAAALLAGRVLAR